jgi:hypothetical protein
MDRICHFLDARFEQPTCIGVGQHDGGDIRTQFGLQRIGINMAVGGGRHLVHDKAGEAGRRRIGAMGGFRH